MLQPSITTGALLEPRPSKSPSSDEATTSCKRFVAEARSLHWLAVQIGSSTATPHAAKGCAKREYKQNGPYEPAGPGPAPAPATATSTPFTSSPLQAACHQNSSAVRRPSATTRKRRIATPSPFCAIRGPSNQSAPFQTSSNDPSSRISQRRATSPNKPGGTVRRALSASFSARAETSHSASARQRCSRTWAWRCASSGSVTGCTAAQRKEVPRTARRLSAVPSSHENDVVRFSHVSSAATSTLSPSREACASAYQCGK
mmetsp:Transcript_78806/g.219071  ORF Transcript_78806/g.219071 Transcript_78806/m.219071 type:complete len:259 (-) Transcript_78806:71-847(-)